MSSRRRAKGDEEEEVVQSRTVDVMMHVTVEWRAAGGGRGYTVLANLAEQGYIVAVEQWWCIVGGGWLVVATSRSRQQPTWLRAPALVMIQQGARIRRPATNLNNDPDA